MRSCDQTCSFCARDFWKFVKARESQMSKPIKGENTSFMQAVETAIRA